MEYINRQPIREHIFRGLTRSLCPVCLRIVDAQVLIRDGALYLRKRCPEDGWHEALVMSDADWALNGQRYNKPGAIPYDFATSVDKGCPNDCGLCPEHQQHTCVGVIEITSRCNLGCSTCFADAGSRGTAPDGHDLSLAQVEAMLDRFVEAEGQPEVLQISGGEPTIHPQILDILDAAKAREIRHVMLNTNGLRIAQEPGFAEQLARYAPSIYLQFDGLRDSTYRTLRGRDLRAVKQKAIEHLSETEMSVILVATIVRGVNEDEIGDIMRYGLEHPAVQGVSFQPVSLTGRCLEQDPVNRVTLTDVLDAIEAQTAPMFRKDDFIPVPCPHPSCSACTYAFVAGDQVIPIPRLINVDDYLDFVTNRAGPSFTDELQQAMEGLWSMAASMGAEKTMDDLTCVACGIDIPLPADSAFLKRHFFLVQIHSFMDEHTFDLARLQKCCIHELLPDGRAVPFCAYNVLGQREKRRKEQETRK
jgi:7,8-dihydro-6-hydroxymethylpterin dimethyltransferase